MSKELEAALKETTQKYMKDRDIFRVELFKDLRDRVKTLFEILDTLKGKEYIDSFMKISDKVLPQLKAIEIQGESQTPMIVINNSGKTINQDSEV